MQVKSIITIIFFSVLVYALMILYGDLMSLEKALLNIDLSLLFLILALTTLNLIFRFFRWHYYVSRVCSLKISDSVLIFLLGNSMTLSPGKVGEVVKCFILKDLYKLPIRKTLPIIILERLTDFLSMLVLILLSSHFFFSSYFTSSAISIFLVIASILTIKSKKVESTLLLFLSKKFRYKKMGDFHKNLKKSLSAENILIGLLFGIPAWFFECLGLFLTIKLFKQSLPLIHAIFVYSFSSIAGAVLMLPGGLGITEASLAGLLSYLGIEKSLSIGISLVIRLCTLWFAVFIGIIAFFVFKIKSKEKG